MHRVDPDPSDLFVNVSYMDDRPGAHPLEHLRRDSSRTRSTPSSGPVRRTAVDLFRRHANDIAARMTWGEGFHIRDPLASSRAPTWTDGAAELFFETEPGHEVEVEITFGHHRPPSTLPAEVRIEVDGEVVASTTLTEQPGRLAALAPARVRFHVTSPESGVPVHVRILSDSFIPAEVLGTADVRQLGVPMLAVSTGSGATRVLARPVPGAPHAARQPRLARLVRHGGVDLGVLARVGAAWWDIDTEVLYPPVTMHVAGREGADDPQRRPLLRRRSGPLQEAARAGAGLPRPLRRRRAGLDAAPRGRLQPRRPGPTSTPCAGRRPATRWSSTSTAPGAELEALYGRASIYWHASGLGEDEERHPDRMEHFGITTVEAMSAGAVPVVIGKAGQIETVRHGIDGFHFQHVDGLVALTRQLVDDPLLVERMRASGTVRAQGFSPEAFAANLWAIVERVLPAPDPAVS